jgi:hypothetical protein
MGPYRRGAAGSPNDVMLDVKIDPLNDSGGGGAVSTAADYLSFCQMMLNGGTLDGRRYLSPTSVKLMASAIARHPRNHPTSIPPRNRDAELIENTMIDVRHLAPSPQPVNAIGLSAFQVLPGQLELFESVLTRGGPAFLAGLSGGLIPVQPGTLNLLKPKLVAVRAYVGLRSDRLENVCAHVRSWPGSCLLTSK